MSENRAAVLVLGGFGTFGSRIAAAMSKIPDLSVIAAGRHVPENLAGHKAPIRTLRLDSKDLTQARMKDLRISIVIDTVGPFHSRDRSIAQACIDLGIHYIDVADDREFVVGVRALNAAALGAGSLIVSGASTVPALSSAVIDYLAPEFSCIDEIDIGIAPGYDAPRGLATIRSILGYAGRRIPVWRDGRMQSARGWGENRRHRYPAPVGVRNLALVDVPDMSLTPAQFPQLARLSVRAGLEVPIAHHGLRLMSALVSAGVLRNLAGRAELMRRLSHLFDRFGNNNGAMHVCLRGRDSEGSARSTTWTLVAEHGDGPQIPATAAVLIAKRLLGVPGYAPLTRRGAMPAANLLSLQEFVREWQPLAITTITRDDERRLRDLQAT